MKKLDVLEENVLKAFRNATKDTKKTLTDLFGEKLFDQKITDRIKTFEDACEVMGLNPDAFRLSSNATDVEISINAYKCLAMVIVPALNEGWKPDYSNSNEYKYYPWFEYKGAGFAFSGTDYHFTAASTPVGARLVFKSRELAEYAAITFKEIYNLYLN